MAGPVGMGSSSGRQRVFVLVDKGSAQGVFTSWEAAETYADEHKFSLDHLMEYITRSDHPDHLHLMAAKWDGDWEFQGEWTRQAPKWPSPPKKVRLDHYHARGGGFQLLRQKEFTWEPGLLWKVNPMAPEEALRTELPPVSSGETKSPDWKPILTPLKPLGPGGPSIEKPAEPPRESTPATPSPVEKPAPEGPRQPVPSAGVGSQDRPPPPGQAPAKSLVTEPEPPVEEESGPKGPATQPPSPAKPKLSVVEPGSKPPAEKQAAAKGSSADSHPETGKPKITFQKKSTLRLRSKKGAPEPIPSFKPIVTPPDLAGSSPSSVELAQQQEAALAKAEAERQKASMKVRRVWSIRLILTMVFLVACWGAGIFWVFRPEPTVANILFGVTSLNSARTKIMEPEMVFFQLPVDPVNQDRWIQNLKLQPIREGQIISIPTYHALDTWEKGSGFVRPPFSLTEVDEWWDLRLRKIRYGFTHPWEDGTILVLDLESDTMIGWAKAKNLPEILN